MLDHINKFLKYLLIHVILDLSLDLSLSLSLWVCMTAIDGHFLSLIILDDKNNTCIYTASFLAW